MTLLRTHILLEPRQQQLLAEIAHREKRSVSDLAREIIQQGLEQRQALYTQEQQRRLDALENARQVRQAIREESGDALYQLDLPTLIQEMRNERDTGILSANRD